MKTEKALEKIKENHLFMFTAKGLAERLKISVYMTRIIIKDLVAKKYIELKTIPRPANYFGEIECEAMPPFKIYLISETLREEIDIKDRR